VRAVQKLFTAKDAEGAERIWGIVIEPRLVFGLA
jgi:hypothetical protein